MPSALQTGDSSRLRRCPINWPSMVVPRFLTLSRPCTGFRLMLTMASLLGESGNDVLGDDGHEISQCHGVVHGSEGVGVRGELVSVTSRSDRSLDSCVQMVDIVASGERLRRCMLRSRRNCT